MKKLAVLLHNVRSTHNVGAIFRTADAAGVSEVLLSGYTPTPFDRFGRPRADVAKAALGAQLSLPWHYCKNAAGALRALRRNGYRIVAVEQSTEATDYRKLKLKKPTCFVFGNEVRGLSKRILEKCDAVIEIPMHGSKESLNVSVAAGIVLFQIVR